MSDFATCAGLRIVGGQLMIPLCGLWTADLELAGSGALSGAVDVVIGNLTLRGTIYRAQAYGGQTKARLVGGAGGWRGVIAAQGYGSSAGVPLAHVLQDAASACGETLGAVPSTSVGNAYARLAGLASDVLWQIVGQGIVPAWYVDPEGVTQVSAWPSRGITTPFTPTDQQPDRGLVVIATEDYASWMPGCTFSHSLVVGAYTSAGVHYVWSEDGTFRFEVLTGTTGDRYLGALEEIIERHLAPTRFFGRYAYTISNPTTSTVDATPVDGSSVLPDLRQVRICGDSISTYVPPDGGECHVMFLDGVPTQPICVWTASPPSTARVLDGTTPAAKLGDTVQSLVTGGLTIMAAQLLLVPEAPFVIGAPTTCTVVAPSSMVVQGLNPISGTITTGSAKLSVPGT